MNAAGIVEAIVGAEREAARAMARQAEFIAALYRDVVMQPEALDPGAELDRLAMLEAELATALHVSSRTAGARIEVALALTGRLPGTLAALHAGELDGFRARAIAEETSSPAVAAAQAVLAAGRSPVEAERAAVEVSRRIEERVLPRGDWSDAGQVAAQSCPGGDRRGRHHVLKDRGRWRVTLDPDTGELTWTSPAGQHHHRTPEPVLAA